MKFLVTTSQDLINGKLLKTKELKTAKDITSQGNSMIVEKLDFTPESKATHLIEILN